MLLLSSADFFKINFFQKNNSGTLSECQTVWILIRTDVRSVLIWILILFAKFISRQQNSPLARKELKGDVCVNALCPSQQLLNYVKTISNSSPASHNFPCQLSHLLIFLGSLYCKQYEPRSGCFQGSSLIRVHIVCFHLKN